MNPPRRKRAPVPDGYLPFPIRRRKTASGVEGEKSDVQFVCKGVLNDDLTATVASPGDMAFLSQMGFYGKGNLSKHEPVFHHVVEQENVEGIERHLQSVSMERYSCSQHTSVKSEAIFSKQVTPEEFARFSNTDADDLKYLKPAAAGCESVKTELQESSSIAEPMALGIPTCEEYVNDSFPRHSHWQQPSDEQSTVRPSTDQQPLVWQPSESYEDEWQDSANKKTYNTAVASNIDMCSENIGLQAKEEGYSSSQHTSVKSRANCSQNVIPEQFAGSSSTDANDLKYHLKLSAASYKFAKLESQESDNTNKLMEPDNLTSGENIDHSLPEHAQWQQTSDEQQLLSSPSDQQSLDAGPRAERGKGYVQLEVENPMSTVKEISLDSFSSDGEWKEDDEMWLSDKLPTTDLSRAPCTVIAAQPVDDDEPDDNLEHFRASYVEDMDDKATSESSNDDDELYTPSADIYPKADDAQNKKQQYYDMHEELVLSPYEAVFLKLAFDCIHFIEGINKKAVGLYELWKRCVDGDKSFLPKYAVYHHIRAKGWVPKDGLTYGCDFMVYKKGPKYYHSSLGVIVHCCDADSLKDSGDMNLRALTWAKLMGICRVINNVKKELMICYVLIPKDMTMEQLSSPEQCLRAIAINETLLKRIVPSREINRSSQAKASSSQAKASASKLTLTRAK